MYNEILVEFGLPTKAALIAPLNLLTIHLSLSKNKV